MKIQPLRNLIIVRPDKPKEKTDSGIIIANEKWKQLPFTGTVEAIGPLVENVQVGDRIVFARYTVTELPDDDLRLLQDKHVLGKIDG